MMRMFLGMKEKRQEEIKLLKINVLCLFPGHIPLENAKVTQEKAMEKVLNFEEYFNPVALTLDCVLSDCYRSIFSWASRDLFIMEWIKMPSK